MEIYPFNSFLRIEERTRRRFIQLSSKDTLRNAFISVHPFDTLMILATTYKRSKQ